MDLRRSLVLMLEKLLQDLGDLQHQGSGYYSCTPIARRYNKLLAQSAKLFEADPLLFQTFENIPEQDPNDPADKLKVLQSVQVECGQLITLLQALDSGESRA